MYLLSGQGGEWDSQHLIREYNRNVNSLYTSWTPTEPNATGLFLEPYNAGFSYQGTGDFRDYKWDTYSLLLDGVDDYVDAGTALGDALGDNYAGSLTVSLWFKADVTSGDDGLFYIGSFVGYGEFALRISANRLRLALNGFGGWNRTITSFTDTGWNHLVGVYKSGSEADSKLYLNGVAAGSASGSFPAAADMDFAGLKTIIGAYYSASYTFDGNIDEVAVWDSALSAEQITAIYNGGTPQSLAPYSPTAWWRMGDGPLDDGDDEIIGDQMNITLGSDLITNGNFVTDSDWIKGVGWTISDGTASSDGSQSGNSNLKQVAGLDTGTIAYEVTFTVSDYSAGNVRTVLGGSAIGTYRSANGTYTEILWIAGGSNFFIQSDADFVGSIDNVVVKKINGYAGQMINMTASDIVADTP